MDSRLPAPVSSTMNALVNGLLVILGPRLVGLYLGGSIATGDFCEPSSDLDFLAVTNGALTPEDLLALAQLHRELLSQYPYAARLEGDYAPLQSLMPEGTAEPVPGCERGVFLPRVGEVMLLADTIAHMREHGLVFHGPPPRQLLPAVTGEQVRAAVRALLMDGPGAPQTPNEAAAAILNIVRSACALETGAITTKTAGAYWALGQMEASWHGVIRSALAIRHQQGTEADAALLSEKLPKLDRWARDSYC